MWWPEGVTQEVWGECYWKLILLVITGVPLTKLAMMIVFTIFKQSMPMPDLMKKYCA